MNHVFQVHLADGHCLIAKHAAHRTRAAHLPDKLRRMPANRLAAEVRALKILAELSLPEIEIPRVIAFDPVDSVLVMTEVCSGGRLLENALIQGVFDERWADLSGRYLYLTHHDTRGVAALRTDPDADRTHWEAMLALRTTDIPPYVVGEAVHHRLTHLYQAAVAAGSNQLMNLDFCPKNVLLSDSCIGLIDHELSSNWGDPTFDIGFMVGHYVIRALSSGALDNARAAIARFLSAYETGDRPHFRCIASRLAAFCGATLLYRTVGGSRQDVGTAGEHLTRIGIRLLDCFPDTSLGSTADTVELLFACISGVIGTHRP